MFFPERAISLEPKYPDCGRVTIRFQRTCPFLVRRRPAWRAVAWLALLTLAACETTAPVAPAKTAPEESPPDTNVVEAAPRHGDIAELLTSESCEREGRYICAVEALARFIEGGPSVTRPAVPARRDPGGMNVDVARLSRQDLNDRLWRLTGALSPAEVAALAQSHTLAPLWRLRAALSGSRSAHEQAVRLRAWMDRWPEHPFVGVPPGSFRRLLHPPPQPPVLPPESPGRVGLFVPLSGPLAAAGRAVRDGFIAAYLDDSAPLKPALLVYDTAAEPIGAIYERSLVDGVDLIVGPLSKNRVQALHRLNPELAVLGLNYLDVETGSGSAGNPGPAPVGLAAPVAAHPFLQVGLAIEDEAATMIDRLLGEDLHRLLAVHGTEDWAVRGVQALADSWPFHIELQAFDDVKTITESLGEAMQVAASLERREALERLLNAEVEFLPRARSDLDGVVAFVDHIEASALAPALKFHFASHLPVFASSQSVRNASSLAELRGFNVAEMPFNIGADPLWDAVKEVFDDGGNIAALRALGMDACRIANHWHWISHGEPLYGATGALRLAEDGRIRRTLAWATVARGGVHASPAAARR